MILIHRRNRFKVTCLTLLTCLVVVLIWRKRFDIRWQNLEEKHIVLDTGHTRHADVLISAVHAVKPLNTSSPTRAYTLQAMRDRAMSMNFVQKIKNVDRFGDHRADDPVIVIQSHDRPDMLKKLINSLSIVKGIDGATLVISRDKFTQDMDAVVDSIKFCRYLEVFFPFSMQLYPDKFPGEDPNDCPRDMPKSTAREKRCNNAEYPDMYGHYREVKFVQIKHHWFWKLNMVFMGIRAVRENTGPIILLEDDNYVAPDLIDIMRKSLLLRETECQHCLAITLGAYDFSTDYGGQGADVDIKPWHSSKHNIGMIVTQEFYQKLVESQEYFCSYDDYNWDWTLQSTALKCFPKHLSVMVLKVPRVFHLGCTGFHQKDSGICDLTKETKKLENLFQSQESSLFPRSLKVGSRSDAPNSAHVQNGGWGDVRDHELCQSYKELCNSLQIIK